MSFRFSFGIYSRDEEYDGRISLTINRYYWKKRIPRWLLRPKIVKVLSSDKTFTYERVCPREYSFTLNLNEHDSENYICIYYGIQDEDNRGDSKCKFWDIPWLQWTFDRWSVYDLNHQLVQHIDYDVSKRKRQKYNFDNAEHAREIVPKVKFVFNDYDGEEIIATAFIEEREWVRGTGWFSWLRYFVEPLKVRRLDLDFSAETGARKGQWKGGTTGSSEIMTEKDTPLDAFQQYAIKHKFTKVRQL
jgi:hypothetical protein